MADETSAGAVYLDLILRDTLKAQLSKMGSKAQAEAQKSFSGMGGKAGESFSKAFSAGYNKTLERARSKAAELERQHEEVTGKLDAMWQTTMSRFQGVPNRSAAAENFLGKDPAYQKLLDQQTQIDKKLRAAQENLRIETEANAHKMAQAQIKAQEKAAAAAEKAAQREKAAKERAAAAAKKAQGKADAAQARQDALRQKQRSRTLSSLFKPVKGLFRGIGSAIRSAFLMAGLYAFFKRFKEMLSGAAAKNKEFSSALEGVKSNLATAFAPIVDAVMPRLTRLMQALASVTKTVATFIAALFGQTFEQAQAAGKQLASVTGAAKKAANTMGIDELNIITPETQTGSQTPADTGEDLSAGFGEKFKALTTLLNPAVTAWGKAWNRIAKKAKTCQAEMGKAVDKLRKNSLDPLVEFLRQDFAPGVLNSFSLAFAPITGDVVTAALQIFSDFFVFCCETVGRAVDTVVIPALQLFQTIWQDTMRLLQKVWNTYGKPVMDGVVGALRDLWDILSKLWNTVVAPIIDSCIKEMTILWNDHLKPTLGNIMGLIGDLSLLLLALWNTVMAPLINWIVDTFGPKFAKVWTDAQKTAAEKIGLVSDAINGIISVVRGMIQFVTLLLKGDWKAAWKLAEGPIKTLWDGIVNYIKEKINNVIGFINGMISSIYRALNGVVGAINSMSFTVPAWVPEIGGSHIGFSLPYFTPFQIPYLAEGGYVGPNQPRLAVIGDNRTEGEIVAPESKLRQAVAEGMAGLETGEILLLLVNILHTLQDLLAKEETVVIGDDVIWRASRRGAAKAGYTVSQNPSFA